jgi:RNA polymerase sigma-B factor
MNRFAPHACHGTRGGLGETSAKVCRGPARVACRALHSRFIALRAAPCDDPAPGGRSISGNDEHNRGPDPEAHTEGLAGESELWQRFEADRDPAIREELVRRYLPFAKNLALRYRGASESFDDLYQVASLGLVNAVDRFDPSRGTPFTAFASPTILGELKRHFRDRVWTVRVPRGLHDRMAEVEKAISALTVKLQRSPSVGEIAERLELDPTDVLEVLEADHNRRPLSLDRPVGRDEDEAPAAEWVGDEDAGFELVEDKLALEEVLPHLDERERTVLRLRFVEDLTQSQIAEQIGHSQMHVSRILRRALDKLRAEVAEPGDGG